MNTVQRVINALVAELQSSLPGYTVEAREPFEGELVADATTKQIFVTREGIEPDEQYADGGASTQVMVPVMVACVMQRPGTPALAAGVLRRSLTIVQAIQRVIRAFAQAGEPVYLRFLREEPQLIEGFYVSITGVEVHFDLAAEEAL